LVNIVAIAPAGDWRTESWTAEGQISDMIREFEGWDDRLQQLITSATDTKATRQNKCFNLGLCGTVA